jgi:hypothetical protein
LGWVTYGTSRLITSIIQAEVHHIITGPHPCLYHT